MKFLVLITTLLLLSVHLVVGRPVNVYTPAEATRVARALQTNPHEEPLPLSRLIEEMKVDCKLRTTIAEAILAYFKCKESPANITSEEVTANSNPNIRESATPGSADALPSDSNGYLWSARRLLHLVCEALKIFFMIFGVITVWTNAVEYFNGEEETDNTEEPDPEKNGESTRPRSSGSGRKAQFSDDIIIEVYQPQYDDSPPFYDDIYHDDELYDSDIQPVPTPRPFRESDNT